MKCGERKDEDGVEKGQNKMKCGERRMKMGWGKDKTR